MLGAATAARNPEKAASTGERMVGSSVLFFIEVLAGGALCRFVL